MNSAENRSLGDNYLTPSLSQEGDTEKEFRQRLHRTVMPSASRKDNEMGIKEP